MLQDFRVAVVGSGPAGIYAAAALAGHEGAAVDVIDRLPTPFGLVRYGVAPDHEKMKSVAVVLRKVLEHERLRFLRAATIEDYADLSLRSGRAADAIAHLEALQASEPWRDRCVELLMRALCGSGRATETLQVYDRHRRGLAAEFGLDPSPGLQDLQARILRNELPEAPRPVPQPPRWYAVSTPFVGRDTEMATLADAVRSNRLVTVTGIGGVGKTRLVAESLGELAAQLQMPVAVAELGALPAGGVDGAVAAALGVDVRDGTPRAAVSEYLGAGSQLLVIDNCEHVLADARELTGALLRACPQVRIIATSRHRLGLRDEQVLPLDPLLTEAADGPAELLRDTAPSGCSSTGCAACVPPSR